jgi:hypothetical protein
MCSEKYHAPCLLDEQWWVLFLFHSSSMYKFSCQKYQGHEIWNLIEKIVCLGKKQYWQINELKDVFFNQMTKNFHIGTWSKRK